MKIKLPNKVFAFSHGIVEPDDWQLDYPNLSDFAVLMVFTSAEKRKKYKGLKNAAENGPIWPVEET